MECKVLPDFCYDTRRIPVLIETYWNVKLNCLACSSITNCINRNILECKVRRNNTKMTSQERINRNILECKVLQSVHRSDRRWSINRNILECKDNFKTCQVYQQPVLIETYWNVKFSPIRFIILGSSVLIETYWNVKGHTKRRIDRRTWY